MQERKGRKPRGRPEVHLRPEPRDYVPGGGPPLQPISLLPLQDSTAFIVDRIFLPSAGPANDGRPLPKRMTYIVGWRDLPAARMLVPVMSVLDYVSPWELEDWEFRRDEQLAETRAKLEQERAHEVPAGKRKRGRPPAHTDIEAGTVALPGENAPDSTRRKKGVMSLATPQKPKSKSVIFEAALETEFESETTPSRQLEMEHAFRGLLPQLDSSGNDTLMGATALDDEGLRDVPCTQSAVAEGRRFGEGPFGRSVKPQTSQTGKSTREAMVWATSAATKRAEMTKAPSSLSGSKAKYFSLRPTPPSPSSQDIVSSTSKVSPFWSSKSLKSSQKQSSSLSSAQTTLHSFGFGSSTPKKVVKEEPEKPQETLIPEKIAPESEWEVKRLEGMEVYDVEGQGIVRYFLVRWDGDWPPDQNPSWEPEDNLSQVLIKNYLKNRKRANKRARITSGPTPKSGDVGEASVDDVFAETMIDARMSTLSETPSSQNASADMGRSHTPYVEHGLRGGGEPQAKDGSWEGSRSRLFENFV